MRMKSVLCLLVGLFFLNGCIAINLAGETAEAGVELTGAVIGTTAKTTGAVVGGTADAIIPGDQSGKKKDRDED